MYHTVTDAAIGDIVDTFYSKVRSDGLLGPIFDDAIGDDWASHLTKMKAFWSSVLLASCTYKGNPMIAHLELPRLTHYHFERWLKLWDETAVALFSEEVAAILLQKAQMIGARLLHVISQYHETVLRDTAGAALQTA